MTHMCRLPCAQHNEAVNRGEYHKVTVHDKDLSGAPEHAGVPAQRNHRNKEEPVAWHTFTTNGSTENEYATDCASAWFKPGDKEYDITDFDPQWAKQQQPGHQKTTDCAVRAAVTAAFARDKVKRPTRKHW